MDVVKNILGNRISRDYNSRNMEQDKISNAMKVQFMKKLQGPYDSYTSYKQFPKFLKEYQEDIKFNTGVIKVSKEKAINEMKKDYRNKMR